MKRILIYTIILILSMPLAIKAQNPVPFRIGNKPAHWGYKDSTTQHILIYWHFQEAGNFGNNGLARVKYKGKYGYINIFGKTIIPFRYYTLSEFKGDTAFINSDPKHYLLMKGKRWYEIWHNSVYSDSTVMSFISKKPNIITFQYPTDSARVALLLANEMTDGEKNKRVLKHVPFSDFGFTSAAFPTKPHAVGTCQYGFTLTHFIGSQVLGSDRINLGLGIGYYFSRYWMDTVAQVTRLTATIAQKQIISNKTSLYFAFSPLINTSVLRRNRNTDHWYIYTQNTYKSLQAICDFSALFNLNHNLQLGLGYKYIPVPFYFKQTSKGFVGYSLTYKF